VLRSSAPDELVDAAHRKDSSQLDLFDGQHVKATASAARMRGHEEPVLLAAKEMRMGSSESELNVWHVKPTGSPSLSAVITTTPVT